MCCFSLPCIRCIAFDTRMGRCVMSTQTLRHTQTEMPAVTNLPCLFLAWSASGTEKQCAHQLTYVYGWNKPRRFKYEPWHMRNQQPVMCQTLDRKFLLPLWIINALNFILPKVNSRRNTIVYWSSAELSLWIQCKSEALVPSTKNRVICTLAPIRLSPAFVISVLKYLFFEFKIFIICTVQK